MMLPGEVNEDCAEFSEIFVPKEHTYARGTPAHCDGPHYTLPQSAIVLGWTLSAANTLGMARGAMNTFVDLATDSASTDSAAAAMWDAQVIGSTPLALLYT